jgi:hypothetical protein
MTHASAAADRWPGDADWRKGCVEWAANAGKGEMLGIEITPKAGSDSIVSPK